MSRNMAILAAVILCDELPDVTLGILDGLDKSAAAIFEHSDISNSILMQVGRCWQVSGSWDVEKAPLYPASATRIAREHRHGRAYLDSLRYALLAFRGQ